MNAKADLYLSHAENRIKNSLANLLHFSAKGENDTADQARSYFYSWVGKAQDHHQEDHF